jgi:hypothetical protein
VQVQVHDAEAGGVVDDLPAAQGVVRDVVELVAVERVVVAEDVVVGGQEKAAGPGGRVTDGVRRRRPHHVDDSLDERTRGEVLAGAGLDVLGILLQQPLVDRAFHVDVEPDPRLAVDQLDEATQLGRVLDAVLGLAEDDGREAGAGAERGQDVAVVALQLVAVQPEQALPGVLRGNSARLTE